MRKSRVLLAGVAVAAAAAATTAFTDSNTMPTTKLHAGYGSVAATGANVTDIHYTVNATDKSVVDAIVFTTDTDISGELATLTLKHLDTSATPVEVATPNYPMDCAAPAADAGNNGSASDKWTITCDTTGHTLNFADFDYVGLTVSNS